MPRVATIPRLDQGRCNDPTHIYWMLLFGVIGCFLKTCGFQVGPVILGVILGPMMDANYRRAMLGARGDIGDFPWNFVSHPISLVLTVGFLATLLSQTPPWPRRKKAR